MSEPRLPQCCSNDYQEHKVGHTRDEASVLNAKTSDLTEGLERLLGGAEEESKAMAAVQTTEHKEG